MNITINRYITTLYFFTPSFVHIDMLVTFPNSGCISHLLRSMKKSFIRSGLKLYL